MADALKNGSKDALKDLRLLIHIEFIGITNTMLINATTIAAFIFALHGIQVVIMNLEKSKKRIAKKVKMGFQGYPELSISYFGRTKDSADQVVVEFVEDEGAVPMEERFQSKVDAREDEVIQSAIVKMIERSMAKTIKQSELIEIVV